MAARQPVGRILRSASPHSACALLLMLSALLGACGEPLSTPEPVFLKAAGSTAMRPLVSDLAAAFGQQTPLVSLEVSGGGTQFGLESLRAGEVDLALASWLPPDLEPGWQATAIARDGITIIVHPSNPLDGLGLLQLRDLYSGRAFEWEAVGGQAAQGPAQPVSREEGSGTRAAYETLVMEGIRVTPRAVVALSSQAVVDYVAAHPEAIGYVSMAFASPEVKVLKIEGELPTSQAVVQGSYPLSRELWFVTAASPSAAVQDLIRFVRGPAGRRIVGQRHAPLE
jgi:phosphate transport system substrate-binding protein